MATQKTTTLTFRLEPSIKEALCIAADRDHCARVGIPIQDKQLPPALAADKQKSSK